jgi:plastocyanin
MRAVGCLAIVGALAVLVVAVAMVSRGGGDGTSNGPTAIIMEDLRFTPNHLDATVGVPLWVSLTNRGLERHDLNFPALHMPGLQGVEAILDPGETQTITLRFDTPGSHTFICSLPGHAAAGMTGAVFVGP